jgi:hypothetical protein
MIVNEEFHIAEYRGVAFPDQGSLIWRREVADENEGNDE